ncbi:hypothetical protein JW835_08360, partial [bacterium]|nr:hypothetical protein [bacterium]
GGNVDLVAGSNITITPDDAANTITIAASGTAGSGDITAVNAGTGLTGGGDAGDVTLSIADSGVDTDQLADNAVTEAKITNGSVTAAKIQPNVLSSLDGVVNDGGNVDLVAGSNITITPDDGANTITIAASGTGGGGDITAVNAGIGLTGGGASGDVTLSIADGGVDTDQLAVNAVTAAKIQPNVLSSIDGVANDAGNVDLVAGSNITITPDDGANTITIASSGTGSGGDITAVNAGDGLRGGGDAGDVTLSILDGGVDTDQLADDAVRTGKIRNGTILGEDINSSTSITVDKLQAGGTAPVNTSIYGCGTGIGVYGSGSIGVYGKGSGNDGVRGTSNSGSGVYATSSSGSGVYGGSVSGTGVYGHRDGKGNFAGYFYGNVKIEGTLSKTAGSFIIDHPLDPENKYLQHSFVESPDMMNIYNGNVTLDAQGEAWVTLPDWFGALNRDFRYQLTPVGGPGPGLYIAEKISGNRFKIAGGASGLEVSWQVTGIRHDPYAEAHRIPVEKDKGPDERGRYLSPAEYGLPETMGIGYEKIQEMK